MQSLICVTLMLLTAINVHGQDIKVAVLSPTANQEFYLGEKLFFDYAPLDSNIKQLNIFMESFGKINSDDAIKLVADISKAPNGTYTANGHTYNKYSLYHTIPASLPIENEAFQVSFETSEGDIVIPIKIKAPKPAIVTSIQPSMTMEAHVTEIILPTTTSATNSATVIHTASSQNMITSLALLNSVTHMTSNTTQTSATAATAAATLAASASQTPMSSVSDITTPTPPTLSITPSSSFNPSPASSTPCTGLFSASLIASTTPIPPDPESFMQSSVARNYMQNSEYSFIAATLIALLLVRLLLV
ncbi:unnamed protein product [Mucor circinelloides]